MAHVFLSDAWMDAVAGLDDRTSDPPGELGKLVVNLVVTGSPFGDRESHVVRGRLAPGLAAGAPTTVTVPYDVARALFVDMDPGAALHAFASGRLKVEGDMSRLLVMSTAAEDPTDEQSEFRHRVQALTA
jgi:hypothetical protein